MNWLPVIRDIGSIALAAAYLLALCDAKDAKARARRAEDAAERWQAIAEQNERTNARLFRAIRRLHPEMPPFDATDKERP